MVDRIHLAVLPTPLHRLNRASEELGLDLWIKRDDLTGLAMGGNKARKLEYLMAEAVAQRAEVIVTCGSSQSNFIRQLAAACAMCKIHCAAAVMGLPFEFGPPEGKPLVDVGGNILLDDLLGAELVTYADSTWEDLYEAAEALAVKFEGEGKRVFRIPIGGSSPLGALAFVNAGAELDAQLQGEKPDFIVTASASGSTQTGLTLFYREAKTGVIGVATDPEPDIAEDFADLSRQLSALDSQFTPLQAADYWMEFDYVGSGYGVPSDAGMAAIRYLAQAEGILLDPIYSAKAFAGLMDLAKKGNVAGKVIFWHTGGTPALFALP